MGWPRRAGGHPPNYTDRVGMQYGRFVVLRRLGFDGKNVWWLCRCACGATRRIPTCRLPYLDTIKAPRCCKIAGAVPHNVAPLTDTTWTDHQIGNQSQEQYKA